ncbi:zinc finger MYM-type protein 4-like [Diretmus argenteus]
MPQRCAYGNCKSDDRYPRSLEGGVVFFAFPKPEEERCQIWINQCGRPDSQLNPSKINNSFICSKLLSLRLSKGASNMGAAKKLQQKGWVIKRPRDVTMPPVDATGTVKDFSSQTFLSSINYNRNISTNICKQTKATQSFCHMCKKYSNSKYEGIRNGVVHKICSITCLIHFRSVNNMTVALCGNCGAHSHNKPVVLKMGDSTKNFCGAECLAKFKEKIKIPQPCTMCRTSLPMADMVDDNSEDTVYLFCTSSCLMAYKTQTGSASVSVKEDRNSPVAEDTDEKPSVSPQPMEEDQSEDKKVPINLLQPSSSPSCEATASAVKPPLSPPLVKVKDETMDEEYNPAPTLSTSTADVKAETNTGKQDLKIGSVFSVMGKLAVCSHCKNRLIDGQTVYQRKSFPELFCSQKCLSATHPRMKAVTKSCHYCFQVIKQPKDAVLARVDAKGTMKDFCSKTCISSFTLKQSASTKTPLKPIASQSVCSMCARHCVCKHEVSLNNAVLKFCSDACFVRFRTVNKLSMASCVNCSSHCHNKSLMLKMEDGSKTLCGAECLAKFKQKIKTPQSCTMCHNSQLMSTMVDNKGSEDTVELFCSASCLMAYKEKFKKAPETSVQIQTSMCNPSQPDVTKGPEKLSCFHCFRLITTKPEVIQIKDKMVFVCSSDCSQEFKKDNFMTSLCEYCKMQKVPKHVKRINNKDCHFCSDDCQLLYTLAPVHNRGKHCRCCAYCLSISKVLVKGQYGGTTKEFCSDDCKSSFTVLFRNAAKCDTCGHKRKLMQSLPLLGEVKHFCDLNCLLHFCRINTFTVGQVVTKASIASSPGSAATAEAKPVANVVSLASAKNGQSNASTSTAKQGTVPNVRAKRLEHASTQTLAVQSPPPGPKLLKNKAVLCKSVVQNKGVGCTTKTVNTGVQTDDLFPKVVVLPVPVPVFIPVPMSMYSQYTPKPIGLPVPLPVPMFLPVTLDSAERIVETIQEITQKIRSDSFEAELILMAKQDEKDDKKEGLKDRVVEKDRERPEAHARDEHASNYSDDLDTDELSSFLNTWEDPSSDTSLKSPNRSYIQEKLHPILDVPLGMPSEPYSEPPPPSPPSTDIEADFAAEHASNDSDDLDTDDLTSFLNTWEDPSSDTSLKSPNQSCGQEKLLDVPVGMASETYSEPPPPGPPPMDIEADFSAETLEMVAKLREEAQRSPSPLAASPRRLQGHRKARDKNKGRKSQRVAEAAAAVTSLRGQKTKSKDPPKLKSQYGIDAWKRWIQWRETQPNMEKQRFGLRPMELKEDVLKCTTAELSYGLCRFIAEVKRPNGEPYSPDSLFYLCLGIQEFLFQNGRVENIFTDLFYCKFSMEFTKLLKDFKPSITATGYVHSRVEEEYLWHCKQLGAYSPIVLLNTLLFFCCKYFGFSTVEEHRRLSFAHVICCTKTNPNNTKTTFLRFYPPFSMNNGDADGVPAKKRKEDSKEDILEMMENRENPLRCPVRLYEFYLSKCSESVKKSTNLFYLHPERSCVPHSPMWFSSTPLDDSTMEAMLIRIRTVRELYLRPGKEGEG